MSKTKISGNTDILHHQKQNDFEKIGSEKKKKISDFYISLRELKSKAMPYSDSTA